MSTVKDDCELIIQGIFVTWTMGKVRDAHRSYHLNLRNFRKAANQHKLKESEDISVEVLSWADQSAHLED